MRKNKFKGNNLGIILSIVGILASIILIILNFVNDESKIMGISLLCVCSSNLCINVSKNKKQ